MEFLYDHTDHYHSALFVQEARALYILPHEFRQYRGYSSALEEVENISDLDLMKKQKIFKIYAEHDDTIKDDPPFETFYDLYLRRQYLVQSNR